MTPDQNMQAKHTQIAEALHHIAGKQSPLNTLSDEQRLACQEIGMQRALNAGKMDTALMLATESGNSLTLTEDTIDTFCTDYTPDVLWKIYHRFGYTEKAAIYATKVLAEGNTDILEEYFLQNDIAPPADAVRECIASLTHQRRYQKAHTIAKTYASEALVQTTSNLLTVAMQDMKDNQACNASITYIACNAPQETQKQLIETLLSQREDERYSAAVHLYQRSSFDLTETVLASSWVGLDFLDVIIRRVKDREKFQQWAEKFYRRGSVHFAEKLYRAAGTKPSTDDHDALSQTYMDSEILDWCFTEALDMWDRVSQKQQIVLQQHFFDWAFDIVSCEELTAVSDYRYAGLSVIDATWDYLSSEQQQKIRSTLHNNILQKLQGDSIFYPRTFVYQGSEVLKRILGPGAFETVRNQAIEHIVTCGKYERAFREMQTIQKEVPYPLKVKACQESIEERPAHFSSELFNHKVDESDIDWNRIVDVYEQECIHWDTYIELCNNAKRQPNTSLLINEAMKKILHSDKPNMNTIQPIIARLTAQGVGPEEILQNFTQKLPQSEFMKQE